MDGYGTDLFEVAEARSHHESEAQQARALSYLRRQPLTKSRFESLYKGSRLAPTIDKLRNSLGFNIGGRGSFKNPYTLAPPNQLPSMMPVSDAIKQAYYHSEHWDVLRKSRLERDSWQCVLCDSSDDIVVHHIRYRLFEESSADLMTVCGFHHDIIHQSSKLKFPSGISEWQAISLGVDWEVPQWAASLSQ